MGDIKTRIFPESNYKGIYCNGKTIRIALDKNKPITELEHPEFFDVKITGKCRGGCEFCYMDSKETDHHYSDLIPKINSYFGALTDNQRCFQVALGGGEPTLHPDFVEVLKTFYDLGITPNYTTNGMHITEDIIDATKKYCGGVAISCHPHLTNYWKEAIFKFINTNVALNLHIIISDKESINYFIDIYTNFHSLIDHFVLLPYGVQGRAKEKEINWEYLLQKMPKDVSKIAFGANFYPYLKTQNVFNVSLYEPEIMSKFLDMKDMKVYPSSFNLT